jgi:uncharacterized metal-binding protein YceD (DUF177 family)
MMDALRVPLSLITEAGYRLDVTAPLNALKPEGAEELPMQEVTVRGKLTQVGADYLFRGRLTGEFVHPCDRCLEEARFPVDLDVIWNFAEGLPGEAFNELAEVDEDEEVALELAADFRAFQGNEIDLAPPVWEEVVLALPARFVPELDENGDCGQCGRGPVALYVSGKTEEEEQKAAADRGFAKLKDLFPELNEKKSED